MALTVEEPSGVYQQAGSVDVAHHAAAFFDFQAFLGVNGSLHFAGDTQHLALDISVDFSLVMDYHGALGNDFALEEGVQADEASRHLHLPFHFHAGFKPSDPFVR